MNWGEKADFMIIIYSGTVGIYFATYEDMQSGKAPFVWGIPPLGKGI